MWLPGWVALLWLRMRSRCRSWSLARRKAADLPLPHPHRAAEPPVRRKPPRSWSASRAALPWAWEQLVARPWLAAMVGALAALLLWLHPLHAHVARVSWGSQHALVPAQHSFAFESLYGRALRERRRAAQTSQAPVHTDEVVDWPTLRLSVVGQLTHASRRSISVAYAKHGRTEWLGPTRQQHEAMLQHAAARAAQQSARHSAERARAAALKSDAVEKAKAALEAALAAARRQGDTEESESEQDSSALVVTSGEPGDPEAESSPADAAEQEDDAILPPLPQNIRPLRAPRSSHRWSFLSDGGVHLRAGPSGELVRQSSGGGTTAEAGAAHVEVVRDYDASPSSVPVFLSLPPTPPPPAASSLSRSFPFSASAAAASVAVAAASNERVLCFYVFSNTDGEYMNNLHNFVRRVVRAHPASGVLGRPAASIDYVFLINQLPDVERRIDLASLPRLPPNARYIQHRNECYDWGTIGWILDIQSELDSSSSSSPSSSPSGSGSGGGGAGSSSYHLHLERYAYFIIMNSSVRGPWLPSYVDLSDPRNVWYSPLLHALRTTPGAKMAGPVVSCQIQPHLQSFILMTDRQGLDILRSQRSKADRERWALASGESMDRLKKKQTKAAKAAAQKPFDTSTIVRVNDATNLAAVRQAARVNSRFVGGQLSCTLGPGGGLPEPPPGAAPDDLAGSGVFGCHSALEQAIVEAELGASKLILEAGYNLVSLALMHGGVDFRRPLYQRCFEMRDNPSDVPLHGHLIPRGPHGPLALAEQARRKSEAQGAAERAQTQREFQEMLDHAAHLAQAKSDNSAVAAAIAGLLMAIPQRGQSHASHVPLEGGSASELRSSSLRPTDLAATSDASKRAQSLVSPAYSVPTRPTPSFLSSRQAAVDAEPLWLDPLEVLFGKFKTHKKFPPKHSAAYQAYGRAAATRRLREYVAQFVWQRRGEWEADFAGHRLRRAAAAAAAAASSSSGLKALPSTSSSPSSSSPSTPSSSFSIPLQWGRASAEELASRPVLSLLHPKWSGCPRPAAALPAVEAPTPEEQETEAEKILASELAARPPGVQSPLLQQQRQRQLDLLGPPHQPAAVGQGADRAVAAAAAAAVAAAAAAAAAAATDGSALSPSESSRAAAEAEAASDEVLRMSLLRLRAERRAETQAEARLKIETIMRAKNAQLKESSFKSLLEQKKL